MKYDIFSEVENKSSDEYRVSVLLQKITHQIELEKQRK